MSLARLPTYYVSHGAGPWPYMDGSFRRQFDKLDASLVAMHADLKNSPKAILICSAHWEEDGFAISSAARPGMLYDYEGFPDYTYRIHYKAPGSPELARRVEQLLRAEGITAWLDPKRGYDHGTFAIMKPLYPAENVPLVQLSIDKAFDPQQHFEVGRLLTPLRDEGVLIIGSGQSFQNLRLRDKRAIVPSQAFDDWLQQTLVRSSPEERRAQLIAWQQAPHARVAHPREDHLIPLMVTVGAAGDDAGICVYHDRLLGVMTASGFRFGALPLKGPQSL